MPSQSKVSGNSRWSNFPVLMQKITLYDISSHFWFIWYVNYRRILRNSRNGMRTTTGTRRLNEIFDWMDNQNKVQWKSFCTKPLFQLPKKGLVRNLWYGTFFFSCPKKVQYGTFISAVQKRFSTEPSVRNLYFSYPKKVQYGTSGTKPLFQLPKYGSIPNLVFYETKKGSYGVPRLRTFLGSVKNLFSLECMYVPEKK